MIWLHRCIAVCWLFAVCWLIAVADASTQLQRHNETRAEPPPAHGSNHTRVTSVQRNLPHFTVTSVADRLCPRPGSGAFVSGCPSRPERLEACAAELARIERWPSDAQIASARELFTQRAVLFIGDSTSHNKVRWLTEALGVPKACSAEHNRTARSCLLHGRPAPCGGVCLLRMQGGLKPFADNQWTLDEVCRTLPQEAARQRSDFDTIVWNAGLPYLQLRPARNTKVVPLAEHEAAMRRCARRIQARWPAARLVYKETNHVCAQRFTRGPPDYKTAASAWRRRTTDPLYSVQFTEVGTGFLRAAERRFAAAEGWALQPSHTDGQVCNCTGVGDGRHYVPLVPLFVVGLAETLST